ncbi:DNA polymerase IV (DinB-like DNA polymerase) [Halorubrum aquaticum]|uniref:DNA polymerase IV n=1 Tax=Halorubrum aquaticum TaxID=387340 RepID=A0A1I3C4A7_9EURY|nr:DNA polymerase IV [Halorubrum aquaticum]SFH69019.1 DNA polymerase IV (DinB-like DNA polymerase) [Halorubrum aquaticum]
MDGGTLPGADADDDASDRSRVVFHVDMDCFYASCERLRDADLRGEPVVVGMGYEAGETIGAVATASYEARAFGVESAMPISEALDRLPRRVDADPEDPDVPDPDGTGRYLPVDMEFYEAVAGDVKAVLRDCADVLREVSVDEAYLDVTDRTAWDAVGGDDPASSSAAGPSDVRTLAEGYARHVKERIEREAGVPASVGVAPNMSAAKVASDADKPDGLVVVPPGSVEAFLAPLPTAALHGVGPVTERALAERGIETAGDVADADPDALAEELGDRGRELVRRARGEDDREVTPRGLPKSLSRESSLPRTADEERKRETVSALAADVARRARERGCLYRTIGIKAVRPPFDVNTRAHSLPGPVDDPDLVESVALELLSEFDDEAVRKLGVRVSNLDFADSDQATLGGFEGVDGGGGGGDDEGNGTDGDDGGNDGNGGGKEGDGRRLTDWVGGKPAGDPGPGCDGPGSDCDGSGVGHDRGDDADSGGGDGQASLRDWSEGGRRG